MPVFRVEQLDDPRLAPYRDLPRRHLRPGGEGEDGRFIAEGRLLVERLVASRFDVESVLVDEQHADEVAVLVGPQTAVYVTPRKLLDTAIGFNFHRGMLACGRRKLPATLESILAGRGRDAPLTMVVCADVSDPENVGGILRNSAAFGADAVVLNRQSADPFSRRVLRVSMGASLRLPIVEADDVAAALRQLRDEWQVSPVATVLDPSAEDLASFRRPARLALVFGNEGHGLPKDVAAACSRRLKIPMRPGTDSLNVACASAVFLYFLTAT